MPGVKPHGSELWAGHADELLCGQAICWTTWAIIGVLVVLGLLVFNSFPDYGSQHSWYDISPDHPHVHLSNRLTLRCPDKSLTMRQFQTSSLSQADASEIIFYKPQRNLILASQCAVYTERETTMLRPDCAIMVTTQQEIKHKCQYLATVCCCSCSKTSQRCAGTIKHSYVTCTAIRL